MPHSPRLTTLLAIPLSLLLASTLRAQPPANPLPPTDDQVTTALEKAIDFLLAAEQNDNWESPNNQWPHPGDTGAATAVVLRALLDSQYQLHAEYNAKLNWRSQELSPAVRWLIKNIPPNANVAALQAQALSLLPKFSANDDKNRPDNSAAALADCKSILLATTTPNSAPNRCLALKALSDFGLEIPNSFWSQSDKDLRFTQNPDGSWPSDAPARDHPTQSINRLADLLITQEFTDTELRLISKPDKNLDTALAWLDKNFDPASTDPAYLLAVQRVAQATGRKSFHNAPWFKAGAATLIRTQNPDGSWSGQLPAIIQTSYAFTFLANGRTPLLFNKLQYNGTGGEWNARHKDADYLTQWISKELCGIRLQSQTVSLADPVDSWLDAPLLLITGFEDPKFTPQDVAKLRAYIEAGGIIFSTANANSESFTNAMKKYALEATRQKFPWRQLPRDHQLFNKEIAWGWSSGTEMPIPIFGFSNGIRECWIHSPTDLSADWQLRRSAANPKFNVAMALHLYATDRSEARSNLDPLTITPSLLPATRTINLALLNYPGNPNPEPGAWPRMAQLAQRDFKTNLQLHSVKFANLDPAKTPIAHLTGAAAVNFTDADAQNLKTYLDHGGLLFIDAAAGNQPFVNSCLALIQALYPDQSLQPLPADHPIYTGALPDGQKLDTETSHDFFRKFGYLQLQHRVTAPNLSAIIVAGKTKIIFSPWDITSGLLGTNTWGILGYAPPAAQTLARNILLYSQNPLAPPAP